MEYSDLPVDTTCDRDVCLLVPIRIANETVQVAKAAKKNGKALVIVESPAKARTINRYLGPAFDVMASMGHVRDLPESDLGIDFDNDFDPTYEVLPAKRKVVNGLKKAALAASTVYLATDLDREGEAIAWHLLHALELGDKPSHRVVFNEITKNAIQQAFAAPHDLDMDKVFAQQARRLLDRIVGYQLSPLLQSKIARGLSAGRVQSVAVRLIVEREQEIRAFVPQEHWRLFGCFGTVLAKADHHRDAWNQFLKGGGPQGGGRTVKERNKWLSKHAALYAELVKLDGKDFKPPGVAEARRMAEALGLKVAGVAETPLAGSADTSLKSITVAGSIDPSRAPRFEIGDVQTKRTTTRPNAPFTTASLQQAASSALGFAPSRTMRVAQQLYEGVNLGGDEGPVGLITYMRTDSTHLSNESVAAARDLIAEKFGTDSLPGKPNAYGSAKRAQEAHEAIRPSDVRRTIESVKPSLTAEQVKLYDLIWRRFVACQMGPAQWDGTTILISGKTSSGEAVFRTSGRRLVFDGYLRVMGVDTSADVVLPELSKGHQVVPLQIDPQQHYTSPPPRYTEAALVKKLEGEGIGRPSTYAAIIQTVQDRGYVELVEKKLQPTARGEVVTEKLVAHFPEIMDVKFTSYMEDELDKIEDAHLDWVHVLREFYDPFKASLDKAQLEMEPARAEPSEYTCDECGRPMVYRIGKNGRFLACSGYPECKGAKNVDADGKPIADVVGKEPCVLCGRKMILRRSRLGPFLGCTGYPECNHTIPSDENGVALVKVDAGDINETCDECASAMEVKWSRGRAFLGCKSYPRCKATRPLPEGVYIEKPKPQEAGARCDKCGRNMVIRKGRRGEFLSCSGFPRCRNAMPLEKLDHLKTLEAKGKIPDAPPPAVNGRNGASGKNLPRNPQGKIDVAALGPPPPGFAWTRTGRPVVETWPDDELLCPECGAECAAKTGRFGPYFGCSQYPKCRFVANLRGQAKKHAEAEMPGATKPKPIPTDVRCEECGERMVIRAGRTGPFLGCSKYPKCRHSRPLPEGTTADSLSATASHVAIAHDE